MMNDKNYEGHVAFLRKSGTALLNVSRKLSEYDATKVKLEIRQPVTSSSSSSFPTLLTAQTYSLRLLR